LKVSLCDAELRKVWSFFATGDELTAYFEWLDGPRPKPVVPAGAEVKAMVPRFRIEMLLTRRRLLKAELAKTTDNFEKLHMELADVEHELAVTGLVT
jgi:hypothetical protein